MQRHGGQGALAGMRVVDLTRVLAGPLCTQILADQGAEVIKVEPPAGDPTRSLVRGGPSGTFIAYSHGKKSVCIDLSRPEGKLALRTLLAQSDVLVHNLAPKAARKLGVMREECAAINPQLIYCHIRGYAAGPQADDLASNPVAEAATGVMEANQIHGRPSRLGPSYHDQFAGAYAVIGALASMLQMKAGSAPAPVEIGLYETGLHVAARDLVGVQLKTQLLGRAEREPHGEFSMPGYGAYRTADQRWLYLLMLTDAHWQKFCEALKLPQAGDPAFATLRLRKKAREEVEALVKHAMAAERFDEVLTKLKAAGVGCTEVLPLERVLEAEQAHQPGKLREIEYRGLRFEAPEFPRANAATDDVRTLPPAELGAHTLEVLAALGLSQAQCQELVNTGAVHAVQPGAFAWTPVKATS